MSTRRKSQSKLRKTRISKQPFQTLPVQITQHPSLETMLLATTSSQPHLKLRMKDNLTHGHWGKKEVLKCHPEET